MDKCAEVQSKCHTDRSHGYSPVFPPWSERTACSQSLFPKPVTCINTHCKDAVFSVRTIRYYQKNSILCCKVQRNKRKILLLFCCTLTLQGTFHIPFHIIITVFPSPSQRAPLGGENCTQRFLNALKSLFAMNFWKINQKYGHLVKP